MLDKKMYWCWYSIKAKDKIKENHVYSSLWLRIYNINLILLYYS